MKLSVSSPFVVALLALVLASVSPLSAQTTAPAKVKKIPFHGTLQSVDTTAQTLTLASKKDPAGRVFHLQDTTKITDGNGNPTTLSSAVVGEDVGGSYTKDASGNMVLNSVRLGAKAGSKSESKPSTAASAPAAPATPPASKPETPAASTPAATAPAAPAPSTSTAKAKKQRFSGSVVSVDASSNSLVVHGKADQTFTVPASAKITGAANLGAITAGQKVSGTYTKGDDGSLTVATLKVSK